MTPLGQYYGIVALSGVADAAVTYTPYRTGLKLWYDAADVNSGSGQPTDGDSIGLWKNLSGFTSVAAGGHTDLTMSVAANQPVFVESIPYLSGSQSDSLTYPAMKWFNQDGSQGVNSAMVTSGSLFGGGAGGALAGGMNDCTIHMLVSTCFSSMDPTYPDNYHGLFDNGLYNQGSSTVDNSPKNHLYTRVVTAQNYGFNSYAFHSTIGKASNPASSWDNWYGYGQTTSQKPHEVSLYKSSSLNEFNDLMLLTYRMSLGGSQSMSVNGNQWNAHNRDCAPNAGRTGLTLGNIVNWSANPNTLSTYGWDGYIHEVMIYTGSGETQCRAAYEYFAQKYKLGNVTGSIFPYSAKTELIRWFKADEGVTTDGTIGGNGKVTAWEDYGSSGNDAVAPGTYLSDQTNPQLLSAELNGKDVILFGSASGQLQSYLEYTSSDSPGPSDPTTIIALFQPQTVGTNHKPKSHWPVVSTYQGSPLIEETNTDGQLMNIKTTSGAFTNYIAGYDLRVSGSVYNYYNNINGVEYPQGAEWQFIAATNCGQGPIYADHVHGIVDSDSYPRAGFRRFQTNPFSTQNPDGMGFPTNNQGRYAHSGYNSTTSDSFDYIAGGASWPSASSGANVAKGRIGRSIWDGEPTYWNNHAKVAELMVFKKGLSIQEIQHVAQYLSQKWGVSLG